MGLDMYLTAERYVSEYREEDREISSKIKSIINDIPENFTVGSVSIRVGYWRKANAIHKWFVDNVQNGVDNCAPHYVPRYKLNDLLDACENVKKDRNLAPVLLPSTSGFFFGSTDYDDWYFNCIDDTIKTINEALKLSDDYTFEYQSSW